MMSHQPWRWTRSGLWGGLVLAYCVAAQAGTAADARPQLKQAKAALQNLQQMTAGIIGGLPDSALKDTLVDALAQTHKFTTLAVSARNPRSIVVGREIHRALLELARAETTLRNLGELGELSEPDRIVVIAGLGTAQTALSEASLAYFNLGIDFDVYVKTRENPPLATAKVVITNRGSRDLKSPRMTVIPAVGWVATPTSKWTFTDLPAGEKRVATFRLQRRGDDAGPLTSATARVSYFAFFGQALIERRWTPPR